MSAKGPVPGLRLLPELGASQAVPQKDDPTRSCPAVFLGNWAIGASPQNAHPSGLCRGGE